jgi:polyisoprenoid-binding protein YceI
MKNRLIILLAIANMASATFAAPLVFDFKDPKGVNNATFKMDAPLESISGSANGISGTVTFDPDAPASAKGKIVVTAASLHVPNPMQKEHMQGNQWMDVAKYPEISFEAKELTKVKTVENKTTAEVKGILKIKDVAKEMVVPVSFSYLKDKLGLRVPNMKGDLLVMRADFLIHRADFGINPKAPEDKVSGEIHLTLSIAGASPAK